MLHFETVDTRTEQGIKRFFYLTSIGWWIDHQYGEADSISVMAGSKKA